MNNTSPALRSALKRNTFLLLSCLGMLSCKMQSADNTNKDWNSGKISIATDQNLKDINGQLIEIYEHEQEQAKIEADYRPQDKIIRDFVNGDIHSMMVSRKLTPQELALSEQNQHLKPAEITFAYSAVALVANRKFSDSVLELRALGKYLQAGSPVQLIFDNRQSGIPEFVMEQAGIPAADMKAALVVDDARQVIEYVKRNEQAIGFISFSLISDPNDPKVKEMLSGLRLIDLRRNDTIYQVSQQSLYNFDYPLQQPVSLVLGNNPELVGRGFSNFLCQEKAAKILLRAGLIPRFMPVRKITVHEDLPQHP